MTIPAWKELIIGRELTEANTEAVRVVALRYESVERSRSERFRNIDRTRKSSTVSLPNIGQRHYTRLSSLSGTSSDCQPRSDLFANFARFPRKVLATISRRFGSCETRENYTEASLDYECP